MDLLPYIPLFANHEGIGPGYYLLWEDQNQFLINMCAAVEDKQRHGDLQTRRAVTVFMSGFLDVAGLECCVIGVDDWIGSLFPYRVGWIGTAGTRGWRPELWDMQPAEVEPETDDPEEDMQPEPETDEPEEDMQPEEGEPEEAMQPREGEPEEEPKPVCKRVRVLGSGRCGRQSRKKSHKQMKKRNIEKHRRIKRELEISTNWTPLGSRVYSM